MSEAEKIDRVARREGAEARLARSRPAREAAAAAHAGRMSVPVRSGARDLERAPASRDEDRSRLALSSLEAKVLDAANDVLASKGRDGQTIADLIRTFIAAHVSS